MEREAQRYHCHRGEKKYPHGMENRLTRGGNVCLQAQVLREARKGLGCGSGAPLELWTGSGWEGSAEAGKGYRGPIILPPRPAPKRAGVLSHWMEGEA